MASILKVDTIQDQSGNNIINENANTITIGASGDTINVVGTLQNNGNNAVGITEADQWRLTTNLTSDAIITNLERTDETSSGIIGTGMTESSGVFTFPSTGIWKVEAIMNVNVSVQDTIVMQIEVTIDNSSYNNYSFGLAGGAAAGGESNSAYTSAIIDVTDTANVKVRFNASSISATNSIRGNTNFNETHFNFIRLGDT